MSAAETPLLSVTNLKRHYDVRLPGGLFGTPATLKAVDGISFEIMKGKTLGLVGESGCGKSTTAKLVLGHIPVTAGEIRFDGEKVTANHNAQWRALRRRMQMIYQDPLGALDRRLSVADQIGEPIQIHAPETPKAERDERVASLMADVGLRRDMADRFPHELSGGQRQRVVIARALSLKPDLLVGDEPVSALDVSIQAQVLNLLDDLRQSTGFTALFISHDLKVVRQMSDRVAVMYLGRIVESGAPEEVFRRPQHPYTQALVSAIPTIRRSAVANRIVLKGDPPNPVNAPSGCPFHTRCPSAIAQCKSEVPALLETAGHKVACHLVNNAPAGAGIAAE
ncbi:ATP-binding cassette domain-containing protein [Hoeflea sp. WL0058]|uniref:ATP-binding cassette domain-containing protein n=1 Tax=Flavimaribacter sediminis TaxID=2865987 RepID=A0AAE2ZHA1_9HYPH|nr:oligopeptide/dipeptide ABC transporter ATP-binding protein [Flavimaribacter sediminis]MBW8636281.1 ATP-binding cassette domain-containing protein [Flavimaribacter sediminis]